MAWDRYRGRAARLAVTGAIVLLCALVPDCALAGPFSGTALWVTTLSSLDSGAALAAQVTQAGAGTVYVKAADGVTPAAQFSPALSSELHAGGVSVCAWVFAYGQNPQAEAAVDAAAVKQGAQCLVVDAEEQYDTLYGAAQQYVRALRSALGVSFPIALASQAEVSQHPKFPYSVFLGPGAFNFDLPEMYWLEIGVSVDVAYAQTIASNAIYGRPILPVGQLYGSPLASEVTRFRALARAYGSPGLSFFDLDQAQPQSLAALGAPAPALPARAAAGATLRAGADGDQVVWAQELLNAAGAKLPAGGFFGAQTARAVGAFQARHRLPVNGVIGATTWRALLRRHAREPSWAGGPPDSAA